MPDIWDQAATHQGISATGPDIWEQGAKYVQPAPSLGHVGDFISGIGAGGIGTVLGAYNLLRKIPGAEKVLPPVSADVASLAEPPDTVSAKVGKFLEQGAEFIVPGGIAEAATKGAPLLARMTGQALAASGTRAVQTGGDVEQTYAAGAAGALAPFIPAAASGIKAAAPDVAKGGAKILVGQTLGRIPGLEWPAKLAAEYPGARQIVKGLEKGGGAFVESLTGKIAAAGEAAAPAVEKSPGQLMAEADGRNWANVPVKEKQAYENVARFEKQFAANVAEEQSRPVVPTSSTPSSTTSPTSVPSPMVETVPSTRVQPGGKPIRPPLAPESIPAQSANGPGSSIAADWVRRQIAAGKSPTASDLATALRISPRAAQKVMDAVSPALRFQEVGKTTDAYPETLGPGLSVFRVPIEDVEATENPYALGKGPKVQEYAERIQNGEQPPPAYGRVDPETGKVKIGDGNTRFEALKQAGAETVDVATSNPQPFRQRSLKQTEAAMAQLKEQPVVEPPTSHFNAAGEPVSPEMRTAQIISAKTSAKAQRYAEAVQAFNKQFPEHAFTADELAVANGADRANLTAMLQRAGLLEEKETPPDASFPLILKALKIIEKRQPAPSLEDLLRESIRQAQQRKGTPPGVTPIR